MSVVKNVLGTELQICSRSPITGFHRDGCCRVGRSDLGVHAICARVTEAFLQFSKAQGNDLITPRPQMGFAGLKPGDQWCLCAMRWKEALEAGVAPPVILGATEGSALALVTLRGLTDNAHSDNRESSMDTSKMLTDMCQQVLSAADLKAICKSRGFSAREVASRTVFENYFLSDIGLEAALASLSREEIIILHLLKLERRAVDIRFFECLSPPKHTWHSTFTQRYSPIFKTVQSALIRKGVLLMAVAPGTATKMERWLFRLPQAFEPFLPPVFRTTARFPVAGNVRHAALRQSVMDILEDHRRPTKNQREHPVTLDNGQLLVGNRPFTVNALLKWQQDYWQRSVWATRREQARQGEAKVKVMTGEDLAAKQIERKPFPPLLHYAFSQLDADEWVYWDELTTLLRLFYHGTTPPDSRAVCEVGWDLGCLAKHTAQNKDYYRWAPPPAMEDENPKRYLASTADAALDVDLETIPYQSLEYLAAIAELKVVDSRLLAMPHAIKLGRASEAVWQHPLTEWLRKHAVAFRKLIETVEARRGKQIIHTNLLLARVKDLTLKVALQKAFPEPGQLVLLSDDFIAFPPQLLGDIQRLLGKSGYVVKTIRAS